MIAIRTPLALPDEMVNNGPSYRVRWLSGIDYYHRCRELRPSSELTGYLLDGELRLALPYGLRICNKGNDQVRLRHDPEGQASNRAGSGKAKSLWLDEVAIRPAVADH